MSALKKTDRLFFQETGLNKSKTRKIVTDALRGADGGELYLQLGRHESLFWSENMLKKNNSGIVLGFGLRMVEGEKAILASSNTFSLEEIKTAASVVKAARTHGQDGSISLAKSRIKKPLYIDHNPLSGMDKTDRVKILGEINSYLRGKDPRIKQVDLNFSAANEAVQIIRADGHRVADIRPLVRMDVSVTVEQDGRIEQGHYGFGGRINAAEVFNEAAWKKAADQALRMAETNLRSVPAPAGTFDVVLGAGWTGVMLHEAVGHGLEGDFNRKGTSAFSGRVGQQVAAKGVTVIDQGNIPDRRGSLNFDDEGTKTQENVLIEDGVLRGYMQDTMNARLMGVAPTGNGRRESYGAKPIPRMTNTFMAAGSMEPQEIIASVNDGVYAVNFGGGQVDITSGKFVFNMSEAYPIKNGKVDYDTPLKGATLIGNGPEAMTRVAMVGNDLALDPGVGTCGKDGQGVPVGVGQPTVRLNQITVGGMD